jgi:glucose-6-phosphate 1-dehydrogenase
MKNFQTKETESFTWLLLRNNFETIVHGIQISKMEGTEKSWSRLVIEKPFGKDLKTANALNNKITEVFL